jgi:hypothetical protein
VLNDSLVHPDCGDCRCLHYSFIGRAIIICFILLLATPTWAQTQTSDVIETLHKIKKRGVIRLGYRENSVPFSFLVDNSQPAALLICAVHIS